MCGNNIIGCGCTDDTCKIAVTVEDNFAPCVFPKDSFDIIVRSQDGKTQVTGKVESGGSAIFAVPCGGYYTVTAVGGENSSPRANTKRVYCSCGQTSGVTFIFDVYSPECPDSAPVENNTPAADTPAANTPAENNAAAAPANTPAAPAANTPAETTPDAPAANTPAETAPAETTPTELPEMAAVEAEPRFPAPDTIV